MLSNAAVLEITQLSDQAMKLAKGSGADRAQSSALLSQISTIKSTGFSSDEIRAKYATALVAQLTPEKISEEKYMRAFLKYCPNRRTRVRR